MPAVLAGTRVLISTGTRTLRTRSSTRICPALGRALGRTIRAAYMKGRTNYLCLHRFDGLQEAEAGTAADERRWLERIAEWAAATETGDRAEIDDLPDDLPLWPRCTATSEQCLGRECPQFTDCFVTRMRERAAEARHRDRQPSPALRRRVGAPGRLRRGHPGVRARRHRRSAPARGRRHAVLRRRRSARIASTSSCAMPSQALGTHCRPRRRPLAVRVGDAPWRDVQQAARALFDTARLEVRRTGAAIAPR